MKNKNAYIIAGPNGSGKTTFAKMFLPEYVKCVNFVNADLIAQGLAPLEPRAAAIKAGKLVLQQIREYADRGADLKNRDSDHFYEDEVPGFALGFVVGVQG